MIQLILHLIGDYVTQSDWMAQNKTKSSWAALCHATVYSLPFFLIGSWEAVFVIWSTHFLIDRFRLARYVCWAKDRLFEPWKLEPDHMDYHCDENYAAEMARWKEWKSSRSWANCNATGYPADKPAWLAVWLMIAADNTLHLAINYVALKFL
jgi:hypothetical protein